MANVYFELTREFNRQRPVALLASGQAVVFYRIAMMSKDGDWVIREEPGACDRVRAVLAGRNARYRPSPPLDVRWLAGGWSSHFEFMDERARRVRCDFFSRPPRVAFAHVQELLRSGSADDRLMVVDPETLVRMKQTQRAKDYPAIGEIARLLPVDLELLYTTDPDRLLALAPKTTTPIDRPSVRAAREAAGRERVVAELACEVDRMRQRDRARVERYQAASARYLDEFRRAGIDELPLADAHRQACALAEAWLPTSIPGLEHDSADAQ
ncbi:MAG: hypothetical protein AB1806_12935 [Acidobacteriota bacterium]